MFFLNRKWAFLLLQIVLFFIQPAFGEASQQSPCQNAQDISPPPSRLSLNLSKVSTWFEQPALGIDEVVSHLAANVQAYFSPSTWPNLNHQARAAKVPVMMYHDILPEKKVFFDVTPQEFETHLQNIRQKGLTPISTDQLLTHLQTGLPLPEKPILLTFDDGYVGHYQYVYPLLKKYQYPALFSIYTDKLNKAIGRKGVNWEQLQEMAADPLVTIAAHSVTHPKDLAQLPDQVLEAEVRDSKLILEARLGIKVQYFTYPEGRFDRRVTAAVKDNGYRAAFTMNDADEGFAGQSGDLLSIKRFGQSNLPKILDVAWGGSELPKWRLGFDFSAPVKRVDAKVGNIPFTLISGGRPTTIHAKSRYQVQEILADSNAIAAVDGGFFSLRSLDSNIMIGPVLSQKTGKFVPGNASENPKLTGRPLVLISPFGAEFIPFNPLKHNTLDGIRTEMPLVTDAFVAAAWLVKNSEPQSSEAFGTLFDFNEARHRAFWGINQGGQPKIGVTSEPIGSVDLGKALAKLGFRDAVMLDSGASTALAYKGESLVGYLPRPVPHVVSLVPPPSPNPTTCLVATNKP